MKPLARITLFLRRLATLDPSFANAKKAAESALLTAIKAHRITSTEVQHLLSR